MTFSISPVSEICFRPFESIMSLTALPLSQISSRISLAIFPEIVPSDIFVISAAKLEDVIFEPASDSSFLFNSAFSSPIIHLAAICGSQFCTTSS